jgi:3-oxoacyl-[acyl-carrier-protein] synthase-1
MVGALPGLTPEECGSLYLDLNGESQRAHEWGNVLVRARRSSRLDRWALELPGVAFGETGTASPLLSVLLAARAFTRGRLPGDRALVAVVGEDGLRAAFAVGRATAPGH